MVKIKPQKKTPAGNMGFCASWADGITMSLFPLHLLFSPNVLYGVSMPLTTLLLTLSEINGDIVLALCRIALGENTKCGSKSRQQARWNGRVGFVSHSAVAVGGDANSGREKNIIYKSNPFPPKKEKGPQPLPK